MSLEKCKLKQQRDTTTCLLNWPKSKTLITPNAGEYVKLLLVGIQYGSATLKDSLEVYYKTRHTLII